MWEPQVFGQSYSKEPILVSSLFKPQHFFGFPASGGQAGLGKICFGWEDGLGLDISLDVIYFHFDLSIFGLFIMS